MTLWGLKIKRFILATTIVLILFLLIIIAPWATIATVVGGSGGVWAWSGVGTLLIVLIFNNQISKFGTFINNLFFKASVERIDEEITTVRNTILEKKLEHKNALVEIKGMYISTKAEIKALKYSPETRNKLGEIFKIVIGRYMGEDANAKVIDVTEYGATKKDFRNLKKTVLRELKKLAKPSLNAVNNIQKINAVLTGDAYRKEEPADPAIDTKILETAIKLQAIVQPQAPTEEQKLIETPEAVITVEEENK